MAEEELDLLIERPELSVPEKVARAMRQAILDGSLSPGRRLTERELMELTGVSRTSVREAVRNLQSLGLVETTSSRGVRVAILSSDDVQHIYEIRDALEPKAAELFVLRATDEEVAELVACMDPAPADSEERLKANYRFDEILLAGARNPLLQDILSPLHVRIHALRRLSISIPGRQDMATEEYRDLTAAIRERSPERAAEAAHRHVRAAAEAALQAIRRLEERPDSDLGKLLRT